MTAVDLYKAVWRHKVVVAVLTAALIGTAWFATSREQKVYEASALVRVQQQIQDPGQALGALAAGTQLAETYAKIVQTSTVAEKIYERVGPGISFGTVSSSLSATPVQGLDLLWISARNHDPVVAQRIANAAPAALRRFINETGTLRDQVITVEPASTPSSPVSPSLKLNLALALLLGLILNALVAVALEFIGDRVGGPEELERLTGQTVLAVVPSLRFSSSSVDSARPLQVQATPPLRQRTVAKRAARG